MHIAPLSCPFTLLMWVKERKKARQSDFTMRLTRPTCVGRDHGHVSCSPSTLVVARTSKIPFLPCSSMTATRDLQIACGKAHATLCLLCLAWSDPEASIDSASLSYETDVGLDTLTTTSTVMAALPIP